jgi:enoyl-CoA hydratase/carnithine racemase
VHVVVMTGAGDQAFASGADISEFEATRAEPPEVARYDATIDHAFASLGRLTKPLVARIDGHCVGGGVALALACDVRIATDRSRFAIPAARLGVGYPYGGVKRLVDVVGPACAQEILFSARHFDAAEALAMRLVNRVVPASDLDAAVGDLAARCAANAPLTLAAAKLAVRTALAGGAAADLERVAEAVARCAASADYGEGRRAFMEKRAPRFRGA